MQSSNSVSGVISQPQLKIDDISFAPLASLFFAAKQFISKPRTVADDLAEPQTIALLFDVSVHFHSPKARMNFRVTDVARDQE